MLRADLLVPHQKPVARCSGTNQLGPAKRIKVYRSGVSTFIDLPSTRHQYGAVNFCRSSRHSSYQKAKSSEVYSTPSDQRIRAGDGCQHLTALAERPVLRQPRLHPRAVRPPAHQGRIAGDHLVHPQVGVVVHQVPRAAVQPRLLVRLYHERLRW